MAIHDSSSSGDEAANPHTRGRQSNPGVILYKGVPISDLASPFFIDPSENWGQCLVSQPLTENNFSSWERSMVLVIDGKNKLGFLNGKIPQPHDDSPLLEPWNCNNKLLLSWIQRSVNPTIAESILYVTTSVSAWTELREQFSQGDSFRIADLQEAIFNLKQGTMSVSQYYSKQRSLWDQLANYRFIPDCDCGISCHCILASLRKDYMNDKVIRFLRNLNDSFNGPRSTVMLLDLLPPINKVFAMMVQHERENNLLPKPQTHPPSTGDSMAFFTKVAGQHLGIQGTGQGFKKQGKKLVFTFCGYSGHTEDICCKKNGYPPRYQSKKKQQPPRQANSVSTNLAQNSNGAVMINQSDWESFQQNYQRMLHLMQP
ncbi:unnamed protein product [Linum trigynum]|uniref:Retrotransposon Copia-like N-terminal domain-containing protein n=1 Tax=Linum trigynum TaxID=586398 RepID=A0AAV2FWX6_9ROSI